MNILIVAHFLPHPPHGGAIQRNINLLKGLSKKHSIHYLTFNQKVHLPSQTDVTSAYDEVKNYCKSLEVFEIRSDKSRLHWYALLFFNLFSSKPYSTQRYHSEDMAYAIKDIIGRNKIDVVLIDTIALAQYADIIPDIPKVLCHHNIESSLLLRKSKSTANPLAKVYIKLQAKKLRKYEHKYCQSLNNTVVSLLDKEELLKHHPKANVHIVPNGTDINYFSVSNKNNEIPFKMIFAGGMAWYPNADAMIHFCSNIFPKIQEAIPQATFDIIGAYPPSQILEAAKKNSAIKIHGYVDDVRELIAEAALYVVPIRIGGGTRLKILDAMAQGKAIVSTKIGAEGLELFDNQEISLADNDRSFAEKCITLLKDNSLRENLGQSARKCIEHKYSWDTIVPKLEEALVSAIDQESK